MELVASSRCEIWSLSDSNWTRTKSHLVRKRTLNHLAKLTRWLSCVLSTYLYSAFDCMFLSSHVGVSEWIHTLYLHECQGTNCLKQAQNLKLKWLELDSNPEPLSSSTNTQPFCQTDKMIEVCPDCISGQSIWLCFFIIWRTRFRVNPHSIIPWMSRNSSLQTDAKSEV